MTLAESAIFFFFLPFTARLCIITAARFEEKMMVVEQYILELVYLGNGLRYRVGTKRVFNDAFHRLFAECILWKEVLFEESRGCALRWKLQRRVWTTLVYLFPVNFSASFYSVPPPGHCPFRSLARFRFTGRFISNHRVNISRSRKRNIWEKVADIGKVSANWEYTIEFYIFFYRNVLY